MSTDSKAISEDKANPFYAGAAKIAITPPLGTYINGDFVAHYANYVHDPLFAKALVIQEGELTIAIVVVDICLMQKDFLHGVKDRITQHTGICPENILISSTHTHAAGAVATVYLSPADSLYISKLPGLIVEAVQTARTKLRPAKIGFGLVEAPEYVSCRRYFMKEGYLARNPVTGGIDMVKTNPFGADHLIERSVAPTDPQVSFLAVQGTDDQWISVFGNYSLHYVGDWDTGTITADYFGVFSRQIQEKLMAGDDFVGIMSNGTSADINIWDPVKTAGYPSENFRKSEFIGSEIAEKVFQGLKAIEWHTHPQLSALYEEMSLPVRKPSPEEVEAAKQMVAESSYENLKVSHDTEDGLQRIYAREQVLLNEFPDSLLFPVQAIRIGEVIIGGLGGEFFAATGLWLKENSAEKKYFTIGLANGCVGYVPPAGEIELGGYETWRSRFSLLEAAAEEAIKTKLLQLIHQV